MVISPPSPVWLKVCGSGMGLCRMRKSRCSPDPMPGYLYLITKKIVAGMLKKLSLPHVTVSLLLFVSIQESKIVMFLCVCVCVGQAVSGRYVSQTFDPGTGDFSVVFTASPIVDFPPTVIYVNEKYYYPNGFTVRWDRD